MKSSQYTTVIVENLDKLKKTNENVLYVIKNNIYPGQLYKIRNLLLLCTCYEINENYEPIIYFLIPLDDKMKTVINCKQINFTNLSLISNNDNEINFKKIVEFTKTNNNKI